MTTSPHLRGTLWRLRFVIAAALLAGAGVVMLQQIAPDRGVSVPVTARGVPAGTVLTANDLRQVEFSAAPDGALSEEALVGQTLAAGLPAGMPIPETLLVGPGLAGAAPPGTVVLPVRLADPSMLALVRVGDRLDLYRTADTGIGTEPAQLVSESVLVLSRMDESSDSNGLLDVGGEENYGMVIVAVSETDASVLSGAGSMAPVRAVLVPGDTT